MREQYPSSAAVSANRRGVQRALPVGGSGQARAVTKARAVPLISIGRPERGLPKGIARTSSLNRLRQLATLLDETLRGLATDARVCSSPNRNRVQERLNTWRARRPQQ